MLNYVSNHLCNLKWFFDTIKYTQFANARRDQAHGAVLFVWQWASVVVCACVSARERKSPCRVRVCRRMNVLCMLTHIILAMYRFDVCVCVVNVSLCFPMFCVCVLCGLSFNFGVTSYSPEFRVRVRSGRLGYFGFGIIQHSGSGSSLLRSMFNRKCSPLCHLRSVFCACRYTLHTHNTPMWIYSTYTHVIRPAYTFSMLSAKRTREGVDGPMEWELKDVKVPCTHSTLPAAAAAAACCCCLLLLPAACYPNIPYTKMDQ